MKSPAKSDHLPLSRGLRLSAMALALAALSAGASAQAHADEPMMMAAAKADSATRRIDIPAGPLAAALDRLAADLNVRVRADAAWFEGKTTPGLRGNYTAKQAIDLLLAGSGVEAAQDGAVFNLFRVQSTGTSAK